MEGDLTGVVLVDMYVFKLNVQQSIYEFIYGGEIRLVMEVSNTEGRCN